MFNLQKVVHNRYKKEWTDWWVGMYFFSNQALMFWKASDDFIKKRKGKKPRTYRSIDSFEKHFDDNKYSA